MPLKLTLTTNHGTYRNYDEIFAWYVADFEKRTLANDQAMQSHYDILQKFELGDIHGVGTFLVDTFTTPIIELAEDMETAKGWFLRQRHYHGYCGRQRPRAVDLEKVWHRLCALGQHL